MKTVEQIAIEYVYVDQHDDAFIVVLNLRGVRFIASEYTSEVDAQETADRLAHALWDLIDRETKASNLKADSAMSQALNEGDGVYRP